MASFLERLQQVFTETADNATKWTEKDKGDWFEQAVLHFLNSPDCRNLQGYEWAVLWEQWDGRGDFPKRDIGCDIVVKKRDGSFVAVQCKARSENQSLLKDDMDNVLAVASADKRFVKALVYHTGSGLSSPAKDLAKAHGDFFAATNRTKFSRQSDLWGLEFPELGSKPSPVHVSRAEKYSLRDYQEDAVSDVCAAFSDLTTDAGKLLLPCGTGKTFVSQNIAERHGGKGSTILMVVPSISLMSQTMREWSQQINEIPHRYLGVCSDSKVGKTRFDEFTQDIWELDIPVTTDASKLGEQLCQDAPDEMTVVFSTYQSLDKVHRAQSLSGRRFDLALMDEAHRTTGVERTSGSTQQESLFRKIHDRDWIQADKRLYMTATPKVYVDPGSKKTLTASNDSIYSMDDEAVYGKALYEMSFSEAVAKNLLSPYKVVLVGVRDEDHAGKLENHIVDVLGRNKAGKKVQIDAQLAAKILGTTKFAANFPDPSGKEPRVDDNPLQTMLIFANTIASSRAAAAGFDYGDDILKDIDRDWEAHGAEMEARHVDGSMSADVRDRDLEWLRRSVEDVNVCRILTNAKCLSEGVDVPALDGCVFLEPRKSQIDVVQAVGRIMRKHPNKECGWVILPVCTTLPEGTTTADDMQKHITKDWKTAWDVMRALASHDESFKVEMEVTAAALSGGSTPAKGKGRMVFAGSLDPEAGYGDDDDLDAVQTELFNKADWEQISSLVYPVIVTQLGTKISLSTAGVKAGQLVEKVQTEIRSIKRSDNEAAKQSLEDYFEGMKAAVSHLLTITEVDVMLAQHIVMEPVFEAFFGGGDFRSGNPVSQILESLLDELKHAGFDLQGEARSELNAFYKQVEETVSAMETAAEFQGYLKEIYNAFFRTAFRSTADKLGIAYTPIEVVDFINRSADLVARQVFGKGMGDEDVGIMDPFTGTGTFLARMLADENLIPNESVDHKYRHEIYAYELVLLAYYIASVNIEQAYHRRMGTDGRKKGVPFQGMVLHDTFAGFGMKNRLPGLDGNSRRARAIEAKDVEIIVGNPPYSGGQKIATEDNPNIHYPNLKNCIRDEVVNLLSPEITNKESLYNLYVHALVWAEKRLQGKGVLSFVMPAGWMRTKAGEGLRRWLEEKFSCAWIVDLAGNCRLQGDDRKREGGSIFLKGETTSPIGIFVLLKDPAHDSKCAIHYKRVADSTSGEDKLIWLTELGTIDGVESWELLECSKWGEWFGKRDTRFYDWIPVASKSCKAGKDNNAIFRMHSLGLSTGRDYLAFNSDYNQICQTAEMAVNFYEQTRISGVAPDVTKNLDVFKWQRRALDVLLQNGGVGALANFNPDLNIRPVLYRPFFPQWAHWEHKFNARHYQLETMFPSGSAPLNQREALPAAQGSLGTQIQRDALPVDNDASSKITPPPSQREHLLYSSTNKQSRQQSEYQIITHLEGQPARSQGSSSEYRNSQSEEPHLRHNSVSRRRVQQLLWDNDPPTMDFPFGRQKGAASAQMAITWNYLSRNTWAVMSVADNNFYKRGGTCCLSRLVFRRSSKGGVFDTAQAEHGDPEGFERVDNITDHALNLFQNHYEDKSIDKDAIFFYVYGILHHPQYIADHKDSLEADLPRIPLAPNFQRIRDFGYQLVRLHLGWTQLEGYKLEQQKSLVFDPSNPEHYRFRNIKWEDPPPKSKKGQQLTSSNFSDYKTALRINRYLTLSGIPVEAHDYKLNGLSPLDWIVKQYVIRQDYVDPKTGKIKTSKSGDIYDAKGNKTEDSTQAAGIINDPNNLFAEPDGIVKLIEQATQLSIETSAIISQLSKEPYDDGKPVLQHG